MSVRPSDRPPAWKNSAPTGRIFMQICIWLFFKNLSRKFKFLSNLTKIKCTWYEQKWTFMIIHPSFLLRMSNAAEQSWR
jgi:hypothetical protein